MHCGGQQCIVVKEEDKEGRLQVQDTSGVVALAGALEVNRALISANLGFNYIGDDGAVAISAALENNNTLTDLGLRGDNDPNTRNTLFFHCFWHCVRRGRPRCARIVPTRLPRRS